MIVTERFVFVHMHKTGGQTLNDIIKRCIPNHQVVGYHLPFDQVPDAYQNLPVVGIVRNPWDWYVSWYAFNNGPKQRNPLFAIVSNNGQENLITTIRNLINLGADSDLSRRHRQQLRQVLPDTRTQNLGVGLIKSDIDDFENSELGYYSWMCQRMLGEFDSTQTHIGKFENLQQDFIKIMTTLGVEQAPELKDELNKGQRINPSQHSHYSHYYDSDLRQLVADKEQRLISCFNYQFEKIGPELSAHLPHCSDASQSTEHSFQKLLGRAKNYLKLNDSYDVSAIKDVLATIPDAKWRESGREKRFDIHRQTEALLLIKFEDFRYTVPELSDLYQLFKEVTQPIVEHIARYYQDNGFVVRMVFAKLLAGGKIPEHVDSGYSLLNCHRIHIPIITNQDNLFYVGGEQKKMQVGEFWEINNANLHSVNNTSNQDRVHLIIDWLPNPAGKSIIEAVLSPEQSNAATSRSVSPADLELMVADAYKMHRSGQVKQAKSIYRTVLDFAPKHPICNNLLGLLCLQTGEFDRAIEYISNALSVKPDDPQAHANIGLAYKGLREIHKSIAHFQQSLSLSPNNPGTLNNLGNMHKELGQLQNAAACYKQALSIQPQHIEACHNLGSTLLQLGQYAEAADILKRALQLKPELSATKIKLEQALQRLK